MDLSQIASWVALAVASGLISVVLGVLFADPIKSFFSKLFRNNRVDPIIGKWVCSFAFETNDGRNTFVEVIEIKKYWGAYRGKIVPDARNYERLRQHEYRRPVRLYGERLQDNLLTGVWYHPIETNHQHGSFQLSLENGGRTLKGAWIGYSNSQKKILAGSWILERA